MHQTLKKKTLKRTKFTCPPALWMKDLDIVALQNQRDKLRFETQLKRTRSVWGAYTKIRNELKQKINTTKTLFFKNILNSKNTRYMESHSPYSKCKKCNIRRKRK